MGTRLAPERWRRASLISTGPVAQLRPTTSTCMASSTVSAAPISVPGQHAAGQLDRHLRLQGHHPAERHHGAAGAVDGGLDREQVELGLDEQQVDAALEQARAPAPRRRRGSRRRGSGRGWGTWCPAPWSRPPSAGARAWRTRRARRRPARPPSGSARGRGRPVRTRPARPRSTRRCRSRPRRSRPRRRSGGPGPRGRGGVSTRTSLQPSSSGPPKSSASRPRSWRLVPMAPSNTTTRLAQCLEVVGCGRIEPAQELGRGGH